MNEKEQIAGIPDADVESLVTGAQIAGDNEVANRVIAEAEGYRDLFLVDNPG